MHNLLFQITFYFFAGLAILAALFTIVQSNPVRSVLFLVLTFFAAAAIWILLSAEFLALILILVYVGAVMTLFLFVVMMLNIDMEIIKIRFKKYAPFSLLVVALISGLLMVSLPKDWSVKNPAIGASLLTPIGLNETVSPAHKTSNTKDLGLVLYTDYFLAFELAAALLLVAIISAITLVQRNPRGCKRQSIIDQIMTDPKDRLTMVKMKTEIYPTKG